MDEKKQHFAHDGSPPPCEPFPPKTFYRPEKPLDDVSTLSSASIRHWASPPPVDHDRDLYGYPCLAQTPLPPGPLLPLPSHLPGDSPPAQNVGADAGKQPRGARRRRLRLHCGRFWPCYLIALVILNAIFLPLLFLKIVPAIAQGMVDDLDLPLPNTTLRLVSADEVAVGVNTALEIPKGIKASVDNFTLSLYDPATQGGFYPYLELPVPAMTVDGYTNLDLPEQTLRIANMTEVTRFLNQTVTSESAQVGVRGDTMVRLGALHFPIRVDRTLSLAALNNLRGVTIDDLDLVLPPAWDGANLRGNITIPNRSGLALDLGDVTLNILAGEEAIGVVTLANLELAPGSQRRPFAGTLFIDRALTQLGPLMQQQPGALSSGRLTLNVSGNATVVRGQRVAYVEDVLARARIPTAVPIMKLVGELLHGVLGDSGGGDGHDEDPNQLLARGLLDTLVSSATSGAVTGEVGKITGKIAKLLGDFLHNLNITLALGESLIEVSNEGKVVG